MRKILNELKDFYNGLKVELKLFKTDKDFRKECITYLTSPQYLKMVVFVLAMGIAHGTILAMIRYIASINI